MKKISAAIAACQAAAEDAEDNAELAEASATDALEAIVKAPRITNGYWEIYNTSTKQYENTEVKARGDDGENGLDGNGIATVVVNDDYSITFTFDDGTDYTTPSMRGPQGDPGEDTLPSVTSTDNGKVLTVVNGEWAPAIPSGGGSGVLIAHATFDNAELENMQCTLDVTPSDVYSAMLNGTPVFVLFDMREQTNSEVGLYILYSIQFHDNVYEASTNLYVFYAANDDDYLSSVYPT